MKIRIRGNSIRLRLSQTEVRTLDSEGLVSERTLFPNSTDPAFQYRVQAHSEIGNVDATFAEGIITILVPTSMVQGWANSDEVGIEAACPTSQGPLRIYVEKDFA